MKRKRSAANGLKGIKERNDIIWYEQKYALQKSK